MNQTQINEAINNAFGNLAECNAMLYDYWISELYDDEGDMIEKQWCEATLNQMEKDVMMQMQAIWWIKLPFWL